MIKVKDDEAEGSLARKCCHANDINLSEIL